MTSVPCCTRESMVRQWFIGSAAHCASDCWCACEARLMGTQGNHQSGARSDLEVGVVKGTRGTHWARLEPRQRLPRLFPCRSRRCCLLRPSKCICWARRLRGDFVWLPHSPHAGFGIGLHPTPSRWAAVGVQAKASTSKPAERASFSLRSSPPEPAPSGPHRSVPTSEHWLQSCP